MVKENVAPQTSRQLADFSSDPNKAFNLKLEQAALVDVDVGEVFVKDTYVTKWD